MSNSKDIIIELKDVSKTYRLKSVDVVVLRNISLRLERGHMYAIMGPSGSGK